MNFVNRNFHFYILSKFYSKILQIVLALDHNSIDFAILSLLLILI